MPTQVPVVVGLNPGGAPATAGDLTGNYFSPADSRQKFAVYIYNGSGASITVTLDDVNTATPESAQAFNPDVQVVVPATAVRMLLLSDTSRYLNAANGRITLTPSSAASLQFIVYGL